MKKIIKKMKIFLDYKSVEFSVFSAWKKRHYKVVKNGQLELNKLTSEEKRDYLNYWKTLNTNVSVGTVEIVKSLTGNYNKLIVPEEVFVLKIEPNLNNRKEVVFLENKTIYNKWFGSDFPINYFHRIAGEYYTNDFIAINNIVDYIKNANFRFPVVFKPSLDTYGGVGVTFVENSDDLLSLILTYNNFVVQEKIVQNSAINLINESSVNTIRVCLLRRPINNDIVVLNTSLRMGKDGSLDNETAGGIVCFINKNGIMNDYAVDKYAVKYLAHPNSNFVFADKIIPFYDDLIFKSIEISKMIINTNVMSLDMCLDDKGKWRCIELNLFGQTIRFSQYGGQPFFGEYTDEVVKFIQSKKI